MPSKKKTKTTLAKNKTTKRRRGRPAKSDASLQPNFSLENIVDHAVNLAKTEGMDAISMVRVAKDLKVAPGLIHYYVGSIGELYSAVLNHAFRERFEATPEPSGDWEKDLERLAESSVTTLERWPGIGTHTMMHTHFRLFQKVEAGRVDYGLAYFNRFGEILKAGGFSKKSAALAYHIFNLFILTVVVEREQNQSPDKHAEFIKKYVSSHKNEGIPGALFLMTAFSKLDSRTTFKTFMKILLKGFEALD